MKEQIQVGNLQGNLEKPCGKDFSASTNLFHRLSELFRHEKPYRAKNLKLVHICEMLQASPRRISTALKKEGFRNFAHFVNYHRIQDACKLMDSDENDIYTVEAIAEMSNFGSRQSFYNAFEAIIGVKPSQYRNFERGQLCKE